MADLSFELVGQRTIPKGRQSWKFLEDQIDKLKPGLAIRMVLPKGQSIPPVYSAWIRYCRRRGVKPYTKISTNANGTRTIFLWYKGEPN